VACILSMDGTRGAVNTELRIFWVKLTNVMRWERNLKVTRREHRRRNDDAGEMDSTTH